MCKWSMNWPWSTEIRKNVRNTNNDYKDKQQLKQQTKSTMTYKIERRLNIRQERPY